MAVFALTAILLVLLNFTNALYKPVKPSSPVQEAGHGSSGWVGGDENADADDGTVNLGYARYKGERLASGVNQYLGMRYAAAPLSDLRFRAPQEPSFEHEIQDATQFQPICVGTGESIGGDLSEDCLYINVFAPANATKKSKLKVWFYIQGGGYANNSNANYNGTEVVKRSGDNIVFVNFNYRVGALGFLAGEKVRRNGALNAGLLDQRKALEWVQKYIHLFGGDPEHVVIHGASAGAGSVAYHMAAYGGRNDGLFVGAIPESPFFPTHRTVEQSEFQFDHFVEETGCSGASDAMKCLRSKDINTIQVANKLEPFPGGSGPSRWYFLPVIDGDFSRGYLYTEFKEGNFVKVPTIVGGDTDEGTYFAPNASSQEQVTAFLKNNYPNLTASQLESIIALYPKEDPYPEHQPYFPSGSLAYGDSTFTCGGLLMSEAVSKYLSPSQSWNYRYNVLDPTFYSMGLGVAHTSESPAIFGIGNTGQGAPSLATTNSAIVPIVMDYYLSFIQTLDPNNLKARTAPHWIPYRGSNGGATEQRLKLETTSTEMERIPEVQEKRCELWKSLYTTMQQ